MPSHDSNICKVGTISAHDGSNEAPKIFIISVYWSHFHGQTIVHCPRFLTLNPCPSKQLMYEILWGNNCLRQSQELSEIVPQCLQLVPHNAQHFWLYLDELWGRISSWWHACLMKSKILQRSIQVACAYLSWNKSWYPCPRYFLSSLDFLCGCCGYHPSASCTACCCPWSI